MAVDWGAAPDTPGLKVRWKDGWIEAFPEDEFSEECEDRPRRIFVYHKREPRCLSEYTLRVSGNEAILNYGGRFEKDNIERDFYIGEARIVFADESRSSVLDVCWKSKRAKKFASGAADASWCPEVEAGSQLKPFHPDPSGRRLRGTLQAVLRPGQLRFRRLLLQAYAGCCISGSGLEDALEAAHIMPYKGTSFDHVRNGLLLRADLHRLYDRLLFSVDPRRLQVRLKPSLRRHPDYAALEGQRLHQPRNLNFAPATIALQDHWRRFNGA